MAQKIETVLIDDIDGSEAQTTVRFGLNGAEYEIDLNAVHTSELRNAAERYIGAARKVSGPVRRTGRGGIGSSASTGPGPSGVREWARSQGIEVKDRGRVPAELVVRFKAATEA